MENPSGILRGFVARLLEQEGAVVEAIEPSGLEFIAPESVQRRLDIPEFGRLGFGPELPSGAERITFESDWVERLGKALAGRGALSVKVVRAEVPPAANPERMLEHGLTLQNAVYRLAGASQAWTRYLIMTFRFAALSDEKRDGLVHLALNLSNGSTPDEFVGVLTSAAGAVGPEQSASLAGATGLPSPWSAERLDKVLQRGLPARILGSLGPFLSSMGRRLERDLERLFDYYNALRRESVARIRKGTSEIERETTRVDAVRREYQAKVFDLEQKYAMTVDVEPVQTLEVIMPVRRFELLVKRRKGERRFHLDWNPLARRLEPPPCEYGYVSGTVRMVCDQALHIVSVEAHGPCSSCGREYCRACSPSKCPRCGAKT
jgi:hypothetical protein